MSKFIVTDRSKVISAPGKGSIMLKPVNISTNVLINNEKCIIGKTEFASNGCINAPNVNGMGNGTIVASSSSVYANGKQVVLTSHSGKCSGQCLTADGKPIPCTCNCNVLSSPCNNSVIVGR